MWLTRERTVNRSILITHGGQYRRSPWFSLSVINMHRVSINANMCAVNHVCRAVKSIFHVTASIPYHDLTITSTRRKDKRTFKLNIY